MGMDLIVHIVKGPAKLPRNKRAAAAVLLENAQQAAKAWLAHFETATEEEQDEWYAAEITTRLRKLVAIEDCDELEVYTSAVEHVAALDTVAWLTELYENWPDLGRDTSWRRFNQQLIVVAGDSSWGDSPDGDGYTTFNTVWTIKGLADLLGIR